jgi:hypothetical protein
MEERKKKGQRAMSIFRCRPIMGLDLERLLVNERTGLSRNHDKGPFFEYWAI